MRLAASIALFVCLAVYPAGAQPTHPDSIAWLLKNDRVTAELDSLLASSDAGSLLALIDSLINLPSVRLRPQLLVRMGYNSNVVSAGRTLGINQFGLAPGLSFYHPSGAYADLTGYWSPEYSPDYYLTIATAGYMLGWKKYTAMAEFNHYWYTHTGEDVNIPYASNLGLTQFVNIKPLLLRLDYQFFFGERTAHRVMPSAGFNIRTRKVWIFDHIAFMPAASWLFGNETVTEYIPYELRPIQILFRIRNGLPLYYEETSKPFGFMNFSVSAPVVFTRKSWSFMVGYTYNAPRPLPGEIIDLPRSGYLSAGITRIFNF